MSKELKEARRKARRRARSFDAATRALLDVSKARRSLSFAEIVEVAEGPDHYKTCQARLPECLQCLNTRIDECLELLRVSCQNQRHWRMVEEDLLQCREYRQSKKDPIFFVTNNSTIIALPCRALKKKN